MKKLIGYSLIWVVIDFIIKYLVVNNMVLNQTIKLTSFLNITYVRNIGAAFSFLEGKTLLFIVVAIITLNVIYYFYKKDNMTKLKEITYSLLVGGIIGNLIDRVLHGYVIDYISIIIFKHYFPIFNFADMCIVVGCFIMLYIVVKEESKCKNIK